MKANIVFIHSGNSWYLPFTLWQCRKTNPDANIYLIGDEQTKHFKKIINHVPIGQFKKGLDELRAVYKHRSNLGEKFELACIERWFILHEFLIVNRFTHCIYLDSDILVYDELSPYVLKYQPWDMTWCSFSAHSNFIANPNALLNYCNLVLDIYKGKEYGILKEKGLYLEVLSGKMQMNISDMTFFHDYNLVYPGSLKAIDLPDTDGTFDMSMEENRVFDFDGNGYKVITWKNGRPFATEKLSGKIFPMVTLHFQGGSKRVLRDHFLFKTASFWMFYWKNKLKMDLNKIKKFVIK